MFRVLLLCYLNYCCMYGYAYYHDVSGFIHNYMKSIKVNCVF